MSFEPIDLGTLTDEWIYRGDAYTLPIEDVQQDGTTPVDLTAYGPDWTAQLRTSKTASVDVVFDLDTSQLAAGKLWLRLTGEQTAAMTRSTYVFDVQVTGGPVSPITVYKGVLPVDGDVTRP